MTKTCFKCNIEKSIEDFYKHSGMADGYLGKCKECAKADVIANRAAKVEYYREYDRSRANLPERVSARKEYAKKNPDLVRKIKGEWAERNPAKKKAHDKVHNAVRDGRLTKLPCEVCGSTEVEAHHDDYSKPLDVRWLCDKHHKEHHKRLRRNNGNTESNKGSKEND